MKLESNMYVRIDDPLWGIYISKVSKMHDDGFFDHNNNYLLKKSVIKASSNILDIIEPRDIIIDSNNCIYSVTRIESETAYGIDVLPKIRKYAVSGIYYDFHRTNENEIKSVLTHEQLELYSYQVQ